MKRKLVVLFGLTVILLAAIFIISVRTVNDRKILGEKVDSEQEYRPENKKTPQDNKLSAEQALLNIVQDNEGNLKNEKNSTDKKQYFLVTKVVDGDTIDVLTGTTTERVRLIGINTPETVDPRKPVECFGREASQKAHEFLENQKVYLEPDETQDERDKYGRLLRYAWRADGVFYNREIIQQGYAYEYTYFIPYKYQAEFRQAQSYARENKLGLWADNACAAANNLNASSSTASALPSNPNCDIKGNIASDGEKIYHLPSCDYYAKTMINLGQGELYFCSEEGAVAAGWRKAQNCE